MSMGGLAVVDLLPALAVFAAVLGLLMFGLRRGARLLPLDLPNERSLHSVPVPRFGGMVMMIALLPIALATVAASFVWVVPVCMLAMVSAIDDVRGLPARIRFSVQGAAAAWVVWWFLGDSPVWLMLLAWVVTVWMANLYNFMDGSDGLAGGMALIGFGCFALTAWAKGDMVLARANLLVVGAAVAFLVFNFHPARVFMGDTGSVPLGFLAAVFGMAGWKAGLWHFLFPVLVFSPFIIDATVTLLRRLYRGERVWQAHKSHYYQRLIQLGAGHRNVALIEYALMLAVGALAIWGASHDQMGVATGVVAVILFLSGWWVDHQWARAQVERQSGTGKGP